MDPAIRFWGFESLGLDDYFEQKKGQQRRVPRVFWDRNSATPRRATHIFGFELAGGGHFGQNAACQMPKKIMPFAISQVEGDVKNSI